MTNAETQTLGNKHVSRLIFVYANLNTLANTVAVAKL